MKIIADDGTEFPSVEACLAHETTLPYLKLLAEVEAAIAQDAAFAGKIEALGTKLARERRANGDFKRERLKQARAAIRADEGRGDGTESEAVA
jgi:hypothetical protein